jgi:hypothetical protein
MNITFLSELNDDTAQIENVALTNELGHFRAFN